MTGPGSTDSPAFDPRHDPKFQRGYRPGDGNAEPRHPLPDASQPSGAPVASTQPTAAPGSDEDPSDDLAAVGFDTDLFHDELPPPRWNPYIALLWAVGITLVAGALALQFTAVAGMFSNSSYSGTGRVPFEMQLQQLSYLASPALLTVGLATIAGLLFWHAWVWRARRSRTTR